MITKQPRQAERKHYRSKEQKKNVEFRSSIGQFILERTNKAYVIIALRKLQ